MIEKQLISNRPALVAYVTDNFQPTTEDKATMAKVRFTDGKEPGLLFLRYFSANNSLKLIKFNEVHQPKGSSIGGQFAPKEGGNGGKVAVVPEKMTRGLTKDANQPAHLNNWEDLRAASVVAHDQMMEVLDKDKGIITAQMGGLHMEKSPNTSIGWSRLSEDTKGKPVLFLGALKGFPRSNDKVNSDYKDPVTGKGDWTKLLDVARCTIAVDHPRDVQGVLDRLAASGMEIARLPKDRLNSPAPDGYRADILINPRMSNGVVTELQIGVKKMFEAKSTGHAIYAEDRQIDLKYPRDTPLDKYTPPDRAMKDSNRTKMTNLYDTYWNEVMTTAHHDSVGKAEEGGEFPRRYFYVDYNDTIYRGFKDVAPVVHEMFRGGKWVPSTAVSADVIYNGYPAADPEKRT